MSVDREYTTRIPTVAENSRARQTVQDLSDIGMASDQARDGLKVFDTQSPEMDELLHLLNDVPPGTSLPDIVSAIEKIKTEAQRPAQSADNGQPNLFERPANSGEQADTPAPADPPSAVSDLTAPDMTVLPSGSDPSSRFTIDAQTRTELMNQSRQLQRSAQAQGAALSQQDAVELLAVVRQLGETFSEQGQNRVTRQELKRELETLRRLMESRK